MAALPQIKLTQRAGVSGLPLLAIMQFRVSRAAHKSVVALSRISLARWQALISVLMLIVLAWYLARVFWILLTPMPTPQPWSAGSSLPLNQLTYQQQQSGHHAVSAQLDVARLSALSLFGDPSLAGDKPEQVQSAQPVIVDAPDTRLSLTLSGIMLSNQAQGARVIISEGGNGRLYAPGEPLEKHEQVSVAVIYQDRVIIENRGQHESLWLYEEEPLPDTGAAWESRSTAISRPTSPAIVSRQRTSAGTGSGDLVTLDKLIKFSLARKGGRVIGFKIRAGSQPQLFERLGLASGDIVTGVNGLPLDSSARAMEIYREVRGQASARLDLLRDNVPMTLTIDTTQAGD